MKAKENYNTVSVPCEKSKMVSFGSSKMKRKIKIKIVVSPFSSKFTIKLIYCIAFGSASSVCSLLKSIPIIL